MTTNPEDRDSGSIANIETWKYDYLMLCRTMKRFFGIFNGMTNALSPEPE